MVEVALLSNPNDDADDDPTDDEGSSSFVGVAPGFTMSCAIVSRACKRLRFKDGGGAEWLLCC